MYLYPVYKYNSYRAIIILFNGLIYHALLTSNIKMCAFDVICNFFICFYTGYYCPKTFSKGIFCIFLFLLNDLSLYNNYIHDIVSQILHVITIHIPFLFLLIIHLKELQKSKCITI